MKRYVLLGVSIIAGVMMYSSSVTFAEKKAPSKPVSLKSVSDESGPMEESLKREARAAIDRSVKWLLSKQQAQGHWSNEEFPALTGLSLWALSEAGYKDAPQITKAVQYLLSCVHPDGSIYREPSEERKGGGLANYNTALCMVALHSLGHSELTPVIQKARTFVAAGQHFGNDEYRGGMGYDADTGRAYADLSNSYVAYEAMRLTESVEDLRTATDSRADLDWEAAAEFVQRVQNDPEHNDQSWASDAKEEKGGFAYHPNKSMAGSYTDEAGVVRFRSYGSMTYAGLLSFIYANVDRSDPRVQSALNWAQNHWTLEENPGMGQQGLFYFYNVLTKGLAAYGDDNITLKDGSALNWRAEITKKLVSMQKIDADTGAGYWVNEEGRWWEQDPVLVTSYAMIALQIAAR